MKDLPDKALDQIAAYFQALSEPTRLKILNLLREHERNVGDLAQLSGYSAANVSRHLSYLAQHGMVERESRGVSVFYRVSDTSIYDLCDLVCGNIARRYEQASSDRAVFTPTCIGSRLPCPSRPKTNPPGPASSKLCPVSRRESMQRIGSVGLFDLARQADAAPTRC